MQKKYNLTLYKLLSFFATISFLSCSSPQPLKAQQPAKKNHSLLMKKVVVTQDDTMALGFVNEQMLFEEGWDKLAQPIFWKKIMHLSADSAIVNIGSSRTPLTTVDFNQWMKLTEQEKNIYKQKLCADNGIDSNTNLFVTKGRKDFFEHRKSIISVSKAVEAFAANGVDPWYAQTILLIESPGKNVQKSWAGANGPFQLMRDVAVRFGLRVNKKVDERSDLNKSATAASKLISKICIPKVRTILDSLNISYNETDTWFRLLVLHAYHAGAGNLSCAVYNNSPTEGGIGLIQKLWQTECRGFRNESQNYSQLALAAHLSFNDILEADDDTLFLIQGDRQYMHYKTQLKGKSLKPQHLNECIALYGNDLVDGTINATYYLKRINHIKAELTAVNQQLNAADEGNYLSISKELLRKRKVDEAIKVLKFTIEQYPQSALAADSLSRAYKLSGNASLALKYERISNELAKGISE